MANKSSRNTLPEAGKLIAQFYRRLIEQHQVGIQFMGGILNCHGESKRIAALAR